MKIKKEKILVTVLFCLSLFSYKTQTVLPPTPLLQSIPISMGLSSCVAILISGGIFLTFYLSPKQGLHSPIFMKTLNRRL